MAEYSPRSSTHWTLIRRAQGQGPEARVAFGQLIERYERSIVQMIRSRRHPPNQTPEEIKQEFLLRVLARADVAALDEGKGSFRGWLSTAVKRHLLNAWDAWHAEKNPDPRTDHPEAFDVSHRECPEQLYFRQFAVDTVQHVVDALRDGAVDKERFDALKRFLPGPQLALDDVAPIASELGITPTTLRKAVFDLRKRFKDRLQQAIAETLELDPRDPSGKAEVERETQLLYRSLCERPSVDVHFLRS